MECHFSSFSRTEVMECLFVHSAGLRLWNDILFINQDLGYGMSFCSFSRTKVMDCHFVHSAGLRLWNVILFIQLD